MQSSILSIETKIKKKTNLNILYRRYDLRSPIAIPFIFNNMFKEKKKQKKKWITKHHIHVTVILTQRK